MKRTDGYAALPGAFYRVCLATMPHFSGNDWFFTNFLMGV